MIWLALILANSAATMSDNSPVMISGPQRTLDQLVAVARKCGFSDAVVNHGAGITKFVALKVPMDVADNEPWTCTTNWMMKHPELRIDFIGNAAR